MVEGWKKKHAYIGFVYIPAKGCDLKSFIIFNLQRQTLLIDCLINNAVTKLQNIKVCSYTLFSLIHRKAT